MRDDLPSPLMPAVPFMDDEEQALFAASIGEASGDLPTLLHTPPEPEPAPAPVVDLTERFLPKGDN